MLAGYFHYYNSFACAAWVLALFFFAYLVYKDAFQHRSFYFILLVVLYSYIAVSSLVVRVLIQTADLGAMSLLSLYFIGSGIGLIFLLININKQIKAK